jgi:hypothetical protein
MSFLKGGSCGSSARGAPRLNPHGEDPLGKRPSFTKLIRRAATVTTLLGGTLLAMVLGGCAADSAASSDSSSESPDWGGQTGALLPALDPDRCGPIVGTDGTLTVLEDTSFVIGGRSAGSSSDAGAATLSGWLVRDAEGNTVELAAETLPQDSAAGEVTTGETSVARPLDALTSGAYSLVSQCDGVERITPLVVVAADPVPDPFFSSLSFSYQPSDYTCSSIDNVATLNLTLSPGAVRFTDSTQLSLRNSTVNLVIAPWGGLLPNIAEQELGIPLCDDEQSLDCLPRAGQMLELVVEIVDQPAPPAPELLYLDANCAAAVDAGTPSGSPEPEPEPACALTNVSAAQRPGAGVFVLLASFALVLTRRRRAAAHSTGGSASGRGAST